MTILIIEDNSELAWTYDEILRFARYEVDVVENFKSVQTILHNMHYDTIISDACLDDTTREDLFALLRTQTPHTRVIIISGMAEIADEAICNGFEFVLKPVDTGRLLALIKG